MTAALAYGLSANTVLDKAGVFEEIVHDLRELRRSLSGRNARSSAMLLDSRTLQSTVESGHRAGYDGGKRKKGSAFSSRYLYVLTLVVTPANEQDRAQVEALAQQVQQVTGESVEVAFVDQAYTGEQPVN